MLLSVCDRIRSISLGIGSSGSVVDNFVDETQLGNRRSTNRIVASRSMKIFPKTFRSRLDRIDAKETLIDKAICKLSRSTKIHRRGTKASSIIHDRFLKHRQVDHVPNRWFLVDAG